jgi:hypothetical protein
MTDIQQFVKDSYDLVRSLPNYALKVLRDEIEVKIIPPKKDSAGKTTSDTSVVFVRNGEYNPSMFIVAPVLFPKLGVYGNLEGLDNKPLSQYSVTTLDKASYDVQMTNSHPLSYDEQVEDLSEFRTLVEDLRIKLATTLADAKLITGQDAVNKVFSQLKDQNKQPRENQFSFKLNSKILTLNKTAKKGDTESKVDHDPESLFPPFVRHNRYTFKPLEILDVNKKPLTCEQRAGLKNGAFCLAEVRLKPYLASGKCGIHFVINYVQVLHENPMSSYKASSANSSERPDFSTLGKRSSQDESDTEDDTVVVSKVAKKAAVVLSDDTIEDDDEEVVPDSPYSKALMDA